MITWILDNIATILISILLLVAVIAIIRNMIHSKKKGKSLCSCGCTSCPMRGSCHGQK